MRLKRKIPAFVFGVSIGVILGGGFFVFKINDIFNRFNDRSKSQITVIEQKVKEDKTKAQAKTPEQHYKRKKVTSNLAVYREADSLINESASLNIATDELVSVKTVKVIRIDDKVSDDSTGTVVAHFSNEPYFIEFWKTPLNSRGYRFSKNKVLLYGLMDFSNATLYQVDDSFYIKSNDQVYRIFPTSEFTPLERVVDNAILAKLN